MYGATRADAACHGVKDSAVCVAALQRTRWLLAMRRPVLAAWAVLAAISMPFAPLIFNRLNFTVSPLHGSELEQAQLKLDRDFPGLAQTTPLVVMVSCSSPCETVLDQLSWSTLLQMSELFARLNGTHPGLVSSWEAPRDVLDLEARALAARSVRLSEDKQVLLSLSFWALPAVGQETVIDAVRLVRKLADELNKVVRPRDREISLQGLPALKDSFKERTLHEFFVKDVLTAPFALVVFLYQVRSWRLALLCAACMAISVDVAFASLLLILNRGMSLNTMTPAMMVVNCVAMSADYAMFIMSRFAEEVQSGRSVEVAISIALVQGGSIVALSGTILVLCYTACLLFPGEVIFTLALGALWILFLCVLTSLTLAPCAIAAFPGFFTRGIRIRTASDRPIRRGSKAWFRLGICLTRWPFPVLVPLLLYACMSPVAWSLKRFRTSSDLRAEMPAGALMDAFAQLQQHFPGAGASPVLLHLAGEDGIDSDDFFEHHCALIRQLVESTRETDYRLLPGDFDTVVLAPELAGLPLSGPCPQLVCLRWAGSPPECPQLPSAQELLAASGPSSRFPELSAAYKRLWRSLVRQDNASTVAVITPSFQLQGEVQRVSIEAVRAVAPKGSLYSQDAILFDVIEADYKRFSLIAFLALLTTFTLVSVAFKAAFIPIKLFFTVLVPLTFVFGTVVSAYELGGLDWLGSVHVNSEYGLHWSIPILSAPVLMGLAVDYDVFLFARAYELRQLGFENRAAVVGALSTTGPIISGAGLVMALAFGGMVVSDVRTNCEMGFALSIGILLDTFVVRPLLAPSILVLGGRFNYWPQAVPDATRSLEELEEWLCGGGGDSGALDSHMTDAGEGGEASAGGSAASFLPAPSLAGGRPPPKAGP